MDAELSPREWEKKLRSAAGTLAKGVVVVVGESHIALEFATPNPLPNPKPVPERPKGVEVEPRLPSSKSAIQQR